MHDEAMAWVQRCVDQFELADGDVLDLGGFDVNGTPRPLFAAGYVGVDIKPGPGVDVVADASTLDLGRTFDVVVSTELLEHTDKGAEIVAAAWRHLRPGGMFVATMAGPGRAEHGAAGEATVPAGEWYRNVDPSELDDWLSSAGFTVWTVDQSGADVRCWARR